LLVDAVNPITNISTGNVIEAELGGVVVVFLFMGQNAFTAFWPGVRQLVFRGTN